MPKTVNVIEHESVRLHVIHLPPKTDFEVASDGVDLFVRQGGGDWMLLQYTSPRISGIIPHSTRKALNKADRYQKWRYPAGQRERRIVLKTCLLAPLAVFVALGGLASQGVSALSWAETTLLSLSPAVLAWMAPIIVHLGRTFIRAGRAVDEDRADQAARSALMSGEGEAGALSELSNKKRIAPVSGEEE